MFHPIDWETWPRRDHFNYYYNQIKCRYTLTAHIDIAPLREFQKQRQLRFFLLCCMRSCGPSMRTGNSA